MSEGDITRLREAPEAFVGETCDHEWSEWVPVGYHVERKCAKCGREQYDD